MSKAFAFKNFDSNKILQRNFFKILSVELSDKLPDDLPDNEIILFLSHSDNAEIRLKKLREIENELEKYLRRIEKHLRKINWLILLISQKLISTHSDNISARQEIQNKLNRADDILEKYQKICESVSDCMRTVSATAAIVTVKINDEYKKEYRKIFGARLKSARKSIKLTQTQLAEKLGLSQASIVMYEKGEQDPPLLTLRRLKNILGVSLDDLLN